MSFDPGPGREAERRRLLAEIRAGRERQLRLLAREYRPVAERLRDAYEGARGELRPFIDGLPDTLGPFYEGDATDEARRRVTERFAEQVERELGVLEQAILDEAPDLQRGGARIGAEVGARNLQQAGVTTRFNRATVEAIQAAIDYVDRPEFRLTVGNLGRYHGEQAADLIISAVAAGRNPREIAPIIAEYFTSSGRPMQDALRLTRTTQIYSARQGTRAVYERHDVRQWMWSSALDDRTCLMCISMHGTLHPVSEVLNDHHQGRCAMVPVTPRWSELGLSGVDPEWETGVAWLNRQDEAVQRRMMGPQLYEAWQRGEFEFQPEVIAGRYENDIFGTMRRRRTNAEILGGGNGGAGPTPTDPFSGPQVPTINGPMVPDQGAPGMTQQSLFDFMTENAEDSPLSSALWDQELNLVRYDEDFKLQINSEGVRNAARTFVQESQNIQYGRDYLIDVARRQAAANGVTNVDAEALYNRFFATRAEAIRTVADIGNVRLTEAQRRRLDTAAGGNYLDLVYTTRSSVSGSLANRIGTTNLKGVELREARRNFMEWVQGVDL